jgi:hypothetical protein
MSCGKTEKRWDNFSLGVWQGRQLVDHTFSQSDSKICYLKTSTTTVKDDRIYFNPCVADAIETGIRPGKRKFSLKTIIAVLILQ